jgi:hypothetical protein
MRYINAHLELNAKQLLQIVKHKDGWTVPRGFIEPVAKERLECCNGLLGVPRHVNIVGVWEWMVEDVGKEELKIR